MRNSGRDAMLPVQPQRLGADNAQEKLERVDVLPGPERLAAASAAIVFNGCQGTCFAARCCLRRAASCDDFVPDRKVTIFSLGSRCFEHATAVTTGIFAPPPCLSLGQMSEVGGSAGWFWAGVRWLCCQFCEMVENCSCAPIRLVGMWLHIDVARRFMDWL